MAQPDVVSVKLAPKPAAAASGAQIEQHAPMSAQAGFQSPCILSALSSAVGAGMLGFFFGAIPSMLRNRRLAAWQLWCQDGWRSTLGLGLVSGVYTWVHCLTTRIRLKDDGWSRGVAGCATGLALGWQGGPASALQSCAGLGLVSYIVDFSGAVDTPAANAAEIEEGVPTRRAHTGTHAGAHTGSCCHHCHLGTQPCRTACGSQDALCQAAAALSRAALEAAGVHPPQHRQERQQQHKPSSSAAVLPPTAAQHQHTEQFVAVNTPELDCPESNRGMTAVNQPDVRHGFRHVTMSPCPSEECAAASPHSHQPRPATCVGRYTAHAGWQQPSEQALHNLPPVMWLGYVTAHPYFQ